jgi:heat shock protein HslJ
MKRFGRAAAGFLGLALVLGGVAACGDSGSDEASAVGTWGSTEAMQPNLEIAEDGTVSGTDGCNQLSGSWEETDDGVTFGPFAATQMICGDVDTWLSSAASATVDGDELVVKDQSGTEIGTLERA